MKNFWTIAITSSLVLHLLILFGVPQFTKRIIQEKIKTPKAIKLIRKVKTEEAVEKKSSSVPPPKYIDRLDLGAEKTTLKDVPSASTTPQAVPDAKRVMLSDQPVNSELAKLPAYANYYRLIRDKIRKNAFSRYDRSAAGEVFLSFTVARNGQLELLLLKDSSSGNDVLRRIALESIKDAAPFPEFPEELARYNRLQFSISICFKNG